MTDELHLQISQLQAVVTRQEAEAARLETELTTLERELDEFAEQYQRVVGMAQAKLDAARAAIDELEKRRYLERYANLPPEEEQRPLGFTPVAEQYHRMWIDPQPIEPPAPVDRPREPDFAEDPETRLKRLYRTLARRYHPDLAATPDERDYRTRLMVMINDAYEGRDLDTLQLVAEQPEHVSPDVPVATLRLRQLRQTSEALSQRIENMQAEYDRLIQSEWMRLKTEAAVARRKGRDLLRDMAVRLESEYATAMMLLQRLRQQ